MCYPLQIQKARNTKASVSQQRSYADKRLFRVMSSLGLPWPILTTTHKIPSRIWSWVLALLNANARTSNQISWVFLQGLSLSQDPILEAFFYFPEKGKNLKSLRFFFVQETFVHLIWTRHCAGYKGYKDEQEGIFVLHELLSATGRQSVVRGEPRPRPGLGAMGTHLPGESRRDLWRRGHWSWVLKDKRVFHQFQSYREKVSCFHWRKNKSRYQNQTYIWQCQK